METDIIVSIILSESTASILELDAPNIEDLLVESENSLAFSKSTSSTIISKHNLEHFFRENRIKRRETEYNAIELAYFSDSYSESSLVSFDDDFYDEDEGSNGNEQILKPVSVWVRPLLIAKTVAHNDKLTNISNNIYISFLDSELTITGSGWVNFCRICHGGNSTGDLITPCRCRGSVALAHLHCLEEWLKRSTSSRCELCQHHFNIIREPRYSVPLSILVFILNPGEHLRELVMDFLAFVVYTPTAIMSTYLLILLCDILATRHNLQNTRNLSTHVMALSAMFGIVTIDFTYSSWLIMIMQKHVETWRQWYQNSCTLKLILPLRKHKRHRIRQRK